MEGETKRIKITLEGSGYRYSLFEVKEEDLGDFLDNDRGVFLRNRFRKYLKEDIARISRGKKSEMIQFCTLVDDPAAPAKVSVTEGETVRTYHLSNISGWKFIVANEANSRYEAHLPIDMPGDLMERIESLIDEYLDSADSTSIDALNGEYITFFNLYAPDGRMMLCMRSRDSVKSEFEIQLRADESADIDKLSVMCRHAQDVIWHEGEQRNEYDANNLIYDSRWHKGDVQSERRQNVDYFITNSNPTAIDARWFESWTA